MIIKFPFFQKFKEDFYYAFSFCIILSLGAATYFSVSYDKLFQILIAGLIGLSYLLWGIFYHLHKGDFVFKVFIEYFSFASFFFLLVVLMKI